MNRLSLTKAIYSRTLINTKIGLKSVFVISNTFSQHVIKNHELHNNAIEPTGNSLCDFLHMLVAPAGSGQALASE
jgi:hypothetical protein